MFSWRARDLWMEMNEAGWICRVEACANPVLREKSPVVTLCRGQTLYAPVSARQTSGTCVLQMEDGCEVSVRIQEEDLCVTIEVLELPEDADGLVFGPLRTTLDETIGDVIGVVQGGGAAFGMQSLNAKTLEGVPKAYSAAFLSTVPYADSQTGITTGGMEAYERAATQLQGGGSVLHLYCRDRTRMAYAEVVGAPQAWVLPMPASDPDARIPGAKILFFASPSAAALERIGEIEVAQGLPHPLIDGEWVKTSRKAMKSYLIADFSADEVDLVLDKAQMAGMDTIYHAEPFRTWGHFAWAEHLAASDADFREKIADRAAQRGMKAGLHTLTNFTTTNDPYVSPVPSEHLLKLARVRLLRPLSAEAVEALVEPHVCFSVAQTLNAVQIGTEIVTFTAAEQCEEGLWLTGLARGAFGTEAQAHAEGCDCDLLRDYPYKTLFPDLALQDCFCDRLVELFNRTGAAQISYDGLEGCSYTGHDIYAPTRFLTRCYAGYDHFVLNDASGLHHFAWHIHTRMNWGEPWGEAMRTGQVEGRIRNQDFFRRNLFPRMLGWFLIRLAERNHECTSREDLEWALSEAAGFDAGYAITARPMVLKRHGQIDELMRLIRDWDALRYRNAFSEEQRARLRRPENEFRLEKESDTRYTLFPLHISHPYVCALSEMQPGQPGGSDWQVENPQLPSFAFRLRVEGEGAIRNPIFSNAGGAIKFSCTVEEGQYLLYDFDGTAKVTDKNYRLVEDVTPVGALAIPQGISALSFACEHERDETPDVILRLLTRGAGERVYLPEGE